MANDALSKALVRNIGNVPLGGRNDFKRVQNRLLGAEEQRIARTTKAKLDAFAPLISQITGPSAGETSDLSSSVIDNFLRGIGEAGGRERDEFRSLALSRGLPVAESGAATAGFEDLLAKALGQKGEFLVQTEEDKARRQQFDTQSRRDQLINLLSII